MPLNLTPVPAASDTQVNTYTTNAQQYSSVAALAGGGFVVTWSSSGQDGSGYGIYGQRYDAAGAAVGAEFQVNTTTAGHQIYSSVTALSDGGFVVTWMSLGQDGSGYGIYGQRYDAMGAAVEAEFLVNATTSSDQVYSSVTALGDGGFVVTWSSLNQDGSVDGVYGQRYDATGAAVGAEFQVNTTTASIQFYSSVATLSDGGFVITWSSNPQDGSGYGIYGQRYDAAGAAVGAEFLVNTYTSSDQIYSSVTALSDGGFVVTWSSDNQDGSGYGIYGQRYDAAGAAVGAEFQINTYTTSAQRHSSVTALSDGGFVVTWSSDNQDGSGYGIYGQRFDANGIALGSEFRLNSVTAGQQVNDSSMGSEWVATLADGRLVATWSGQGTEEVFFRLVDVPFNPTPVPVDTDTQVNTYTTSQQRYSSVAALSDGGFVVIWTSLGQDGSNYGIYGQRYDATGAAVGAEFRANATTFFDQAYASVTALSDGGFVVTWSSFDQDGSDWGIYGQRYDAAGAAVGPEFLINTTTASDQIYSSVTALTDGGFVVAWSAFDEGSDSYDVYGQRYDALGAAVGTEFLVNTTTASDQTYASVAALGDGGFVVTWSSDQDGGGFGIYGQRYDAAGAAVGAEFLVNTTTSGNQLYSTVTALEGGGFVITWTGPDGSGDGIYGQRYDVAGAAVGAEFVVNTTTGNTQFHSSSTALSDGGFVVTWTSFGQDGSSYGIYGQRYDANGIAVGNEFRLNSITTGMQVNESYLGSEGVATLTDGRLVATWSGFGTEEVFFRLVDVPVNPTPLPTGVDTQVNTETSIDQRYPSVAALSDGGFVVTWTSLGQDGSSYGVYGQRYDATGAAAGAEFQVNTATEDQQAFSSVTALTNGGFVVTWMSFDQDGSSWGIYGQRYDATGVAVGAEFLVNSTTADPQIYASVTALANGGFVVTWTSLSQDGDSWGIYGQRYDATGAAVGAEFLVNTTTASEQIYSSAAALTDGGFVVTWSSNGQDGDSYGIFGQRYDATGAAVGAEFQVNTATASAQDSSSVTALADGGFVVTWMSLDQDGSDWGIYGQRYDAMGAAVGAEFLVNTATSNDQVHSSVTALSDGGFVVAWSSNDQDGSGRGIYGQRYDANGVAVGNEFRLNSITDGDQFNESVWGSEWIATLTDGRLVATWAGNGIEEVFFRLVDVPDITPPTIAIGAISTDDIISAHESASSLTISGTTTGAEDGQTVTVVLNGQTYTATVTGNAWTTTVPQLDVGALIDGIYTVTADVSDLAGNAATQASRGLAVDTTAPTIAIDAIATDDIINALESGSDLTISGTTTGVEDGRQVTVVLNGQNYSATVAGNAWTATVAQLDVAALTDGPYTVTADVSDLAGNAATQASRGVTVEETPPEVIISTDDTALNIGDTATITFTFSEEPTGFAEGDIQLTAGLSLVSGSFTQVDATHYTAVVQGAAHFDGAGSITVASSSFTDAAGNPGVGDDLSLAIHTQTSSVFWRNSSTGEVRDWLMKDGAIGSNMRLPAPLTGWKIIADGDFNADGVTDIVWMNTSNSEVRTWRMADSGPPLNTVIGGVPANWLLVGSGDFNGDGTSDVLWRNTVTAQVRDWQISNGGLGTNIVLPNVTAAWSVQAIGDFNGDGTDDVLWRNSSDGQLREWTMLNGNFASNAALPSLSADWRIAAAGDFNADGTTDILLHNTSSGDVRIWSMAGGAISSNVSVGNRGANWSVVDSGDYNQDGTDDVMWLDANTGQLVEWSLANNAVAHTEIVGVLSAAWHPTLNAATHSLLEL